VRYTLTGNPDPENQRGGGSKLDGGTIYAQVDNMRFHDRWNRQKGTVKETWPLLGKTLIGPLGVCVLVGQFVCAAARGNEQVLKSFSPTDAASRPTGGLIEDANGVLYGATSGGGSGGGTVFAINPDGSGLKVLRGFGSNANDATNPVAPLALGTDGALYGISGGGTNGEGTVFTLRPDGTGYKVLYSFGTIPQDGMTPQAPLVQGADGTLYGVTSSGGARNMGTVFALRPDSTAYRLLHVFQGSPADGSLPLSGLMLRKDGALYGTTSSGGSATNASHGVVFKLNTDGSGYTLLHSFGAEFGPYAISPRGVLFQGNDGALYGTAGIVFRLNPDGSEYRILLATNTADAQSGVVQGTDGSLYGVTYIHSSGTIYKLNADGTDYVVVHAFGSFIGDGWFPNGPLVVGIDGALYGTTAFGGNSQQGTVFRVTPIPPPPSLSITPTAGGSVHIGFVGRVGTTYGLYSSTNLLNWNIQGTVSNEAGTVEFLDWNIAKFPQRFYRTMSMPH
jgi:uncharacterized repeat protein (TIGR03803 family)